MVPFDVYQIVTINNNLSFDMSGQAEASGSEVTLWCVELASFGDQGSACHAPYILIFISARWQSAFKFSVCNRKNNGLGGRRAFV